MSKDKKIYQFYKENLRSRDRDLFEALYQDKKRHPAQFIVYQDAVLAVNKKSLALNGHYLKSSMISLFAYQNEEDAHHLLASVLEKLEKTDLMTTLRVSQGFEAFDYARYGFETAVEHYVYNFNVSYLPQSDMLGIILEPSPDHLVKVYEQFANHFTGYFARNSEYFQQYRRVLNSLGGSIVAMEDAYIVFVRQSGSVLVLEAVYQRSSDLLKLLSFVSRGLSRVVYLASESEQIVKILPQAERKKERFLLARLNDQDLFERLFHIQIISAYSAFHAFNKPVFNRDFY